MFEYQQVKRVIDELNQIFVSEAHLQLSFAMKARELYDSHRYEYYPEFPEYNVKTKKRDEFDLLIRDTGTQQDPLIENSLIEFKYRTRNDKKMPQKWQLKSGASVTLANHSAQNNGCYDCWSDIERIELHVKNGTVKNGFFIFITNDHLYWDGGDRDSSYYLLNMKGGQQEAKKRYFENETDEIEADENVDKKKNGKRSEPIEISNDYKFEYHEYSYKPQSDGPFSCFKVLIVSIPPLTESE